MDKNEKKNIVTVIILLLIIVTVIVIYVNRPYKVRQIEFLELAFVSSSTINSESVLELLGESYVSNGNITGFQTIDANDNPYIIESVYYNNKIAEKVNIGNNSEYNKCLENIISNSSGNTSFKNFSAIDKVTYICLTSELGNKYDDYLEVFYEKHYDEECQLLFQNSVNEDIEYKISFTIETINLLKDNQIEINTEMFEKSIADFYKNSQFLLPEDGATIFNSGGMALYAANSIDLDIDLEKHLNWFNNWRSYYNEMAVSSWDEVLNIGSSYIPIAQIFNEDLTAIDNKIMNFLDAQNNLDNMWGGEFDEHIMYCVIGKYFDELDNEVKESVYNICYAKLQSYQQLLSKISIKECLYGAILSSYVEFDINEKEMFENCDKLYDEMLTAFLAKPESVELDDFLDNTYYYFMIRSLTDFEEYVSDTLIEDDEIKKMLNICMEIYPNSGISNPEKLRQLCEVISNTTGKVSKKFKDYVGTYLTEQAESKELYNTSYIVDLYAINEIFTSDIIDIDDVKKAIDILKYEDAYRESTYEGDELSLVSTYKFVALGSKYSGFKMNLDFKMEKFLNDSSLYMLYSDENITNLQTNFYGLGLNELIK